MYYIPHTGENTCAMPFVNMKFCDFNNDPPLQRRNNGFTLPQQYCKVQNFQAETFAYFKQNYPQLPFKPHTYSNPLGNFTNQLGGGGGFSDPPNMLLGRKAVEYIPYQQIQSSGTIWEQAHFNTISEGAIPVPPPPWSANLLFWKYESRMDSPINIQSILPLNKPNSQKCILVRPEFSGFSGKYAPLPFTSDIDIDLSDSLLETPDEISFRINSTLQKSNLNSENNLYPVLGKRKDEPYGQTVYNISGATVKNIPANLMTTPDEDKYLHPIYSNYYTADIKKLMGGYNFMRTTYLAESNEIYDTINEVSGKRLMIMDDDSNIYGWDLGGMPDDLAPEPTSYPQGVLDTIFRRNNSGFYASGSSQLNKGRSGISYPTPFYENGMFSGSGFSNAGKVILFGVDKVEDNFNYTSDLYKDDGTWDTNNGPIPYVIVDNYDFQTPREQVGIPLWGVQMWFNPFLSNNYNWYNLKRFVLYGGNIVNGTMTWEEIANPQIDYDDLEKKAGFVNIFALRQNAYGNLKNFEAFKIEFSEIWTVENGKPLIDDGLDNTLNVIGVRFIVEPPPSIDQTRLYPCLLANSFNLNSYQRPMWNLEWVGDLETTWEEQGLGVELNFFLNGQNGRTIQTGYVFYTNTVSTNFLLWRYEQHPTLPQICLMGYLAEEDVNDHVHTELGLPSFIFYINYSCKGKQSAQIEYIKNSLIDITEFRPVFAWLNENSNIATCYTKNGKYFDYYNGVDYVTAEGASIGNYTINGLPYYAQSDNTGGGNWANDGGTGKVIAEVLAVPDRFTLPTNILWTDDRLELITTYFRNCEIYVGVEDTYEKQQADTLNWVINMDVGFVNDTLCSSQRLFQAVGGIKNPKQNNYSFYYNYYPNTATNQQEGDGVSIDHPPYIYPKNINSSNGGAHKTSHNYLPVYSRYNPQLYSTYQMTNYDITHRAFSIDASPNNAQYPQGLHQSISLNMDTQHIAKKYNIPIFKVFYEGTDFTNIEDLNPNLKNEPTKFCVGFFHFKDTMAGNAEGKLDYSLEKNVTIDYSSADYIYGQNRNYAKGYENFYSSFRFLCGEIFGYDFGFGSNLGTIAFNPTENNNVHSQVQKRRNNKNDAEGTTWSGYIDDYQNTIWIGATEPKFNFAISRFQISDFHTPRRFNVLNGNGVLDQVGEKIALFNYQDALYNTIYSIDSDQIADIVEDDINQSILDSVTGISVFEIYTPDENGTYYRAEYNENKHTYFWENSLLDLMGFDITQFFAPYGLQNQRYSASLYGSIDKENRYLSNHYFTTNALVGQNITQDLSLFGINMPNTAPTTDEPDKFVVRGLGKFGLNYMGFQKFTLQVDTDIIRANRIANKLLYPFYLIETNLPYSQYLSASDNLPIMAYAFRQYKGANMWFSYSSGYDTIIPELITLTNIKVKIFNSNKRLAENIGSASSVFIKITTPAVLGNPEPPPINPELLDIDKGIKTLVNELKEQKINKDTKITELEKYAKKHNIHLSTKDVAYIETRADRRQRPVSPQEQRPRATARELPKRFRRLRIDPEAGKRAGRPRGRPKAGQAPVDKAEGFAKMRMRRTKAEVEREKQQREREEAGAEARAT